MKIRIKPPCPKCGDHSLALIRTERWQLENYFTGRPLVYYQVGCKDKSCHFRDGHAFDCVRDLLNYLHERRTK